MSQLVKKWVLLENEGHDCELEVAELDGKVISATSVLGIEKDWLTNPDYQIVAEMYECEKPKIIWSLARIKQYPEIHTWLRNEGWL